ncbi:hypothetical protein D3C87_1932560 [compost metagenome]
MRRHRDDEGGKTKKDPRIEDDLEDPLDHRVRRKADRAERQHALFQKQLRSRIGHHSEEDERDIFHGRPRG